jgi:hypothetical protein
MPSGAGREFHSGGMAHLTTALGKTGSRSTSKPSFGAGGHENVTTVTPRSFCRSIKGDAFAAEHEHDGVRRDLARERWARTDAGLPRCRNA